MNEQNILTAYLHQNNIDELDYFLEWGKGGWRNLTAFALNLEMEKGGFHNKKVLEIGARYGKVSTLFALLGANVTGVDIRAETILQAEQEAEKHNVSDRVEFLSYDGDLDIFGDESFDLVFTKSVLVVVPDLSGFLEKIYNKLKPGGSAIFIENGEGNVLFRILRKIKHGNKYNHVNYFTNHELSLIKGVFDSVSVKLSYFPPIYSIRCKKNP